MMKNMDRESFPAKLKALLTERGMSNRELARRLEMSPTQVGKWINGVDTPRTDVVLAISSIFKVPPPYLLGYADFEGSNPEAFAAGWQALQDIKTGVAALESAMELQASAMGLDLRGGKYVRNTASSLIGSRRGNDEGVSDALGDARQG
jgi:transcriptional regulator with XRE-family HTH domain